MELYSVLVNAGSDPVTTDNHGHAVQYYIEHRDEVNKK
jgi:hypothetical protein